MSLPTSELRRLELAPSGGTTLFVWPGDVPQY
jgi:hypothetical protein